MGQDAILPHFVKITSQHFSHFSSIIHSVPTIHESPIPVSGSCGFHAVEKPTALLGQDLSMCGNNNGFAGEKSVNYCPKTFRLTG